VKFEYRFLRKKVARRVVWLFFLSALVPIAATAFFSFTYVTDLLVEQSYRQLQHASKLYGMAVLDRLLIINEKLRKLPVYPYMTPADGSRVIGNVSRDEKSIDKLTLELIPTSSLTAGGYVLDANNKTILFSKTSPDGNTKVYLRRILAVEKNNKVATLVAETRTACHFPLFCAS